MARSAPLNKSFSAVTSGEHTPSQAHDSAFGLMQWAAHAPEGRLALNIPPRCGSTTLAEALMTSLLRSDPGLQISYTTYSQKMGWAVLRSVLPTVEGAFMGTQPAYLQTKESGAIWNMGTAFPITGYGMDVAIIDGPTCDQSDADSVVHRRNVEEWYINTLRPHMHRGASIILLSPRWRADDFTRDFLALKETHETVVHVNLPAVDARGESLWPTLYSTADFARIKAGMSEAAWDSLYMGSPKKEEN